MDTERQWLRWVRQRAAAHGGGKGTLRLGIGDDAAVVHPRAGHELVITTDLLAEDVHFLRARDPAEVCGWRLVTRALSDLAAMGAEPLCLFLSAALPDHREALPGSWARGLVRGLLSAARDAGAALAGGDVSAAAGGKIVLDVVGLGQVPSGKALRRDGAHAGDCIFVSGPLGLAARGRQIAHAGARPRTAAERTAVARHRHPEARWRLGMALRGIASAAIDISDGLGVDLRHLCDESRLGARIEAERIPRLHTDTTLRLAVGGGEDYELLFTVPTAQRAALRRLKRRFDLHEIGATTTAPGVWLHQAHKRQRIDARGWQHFAN